MLFSLRDVTKTYGRVTALKNLTVDMPEGAIGLLGPNGAGKTTMIRTLLGLIRVDHGDGEVLGMNIRRKQLDVRQTVGFVPEDECLFPGMVGVDFVAYAGQLAGMRPRDSMQRAHEVLDYVGLTEARYRKTDGYSTGMKQRLKLASAIVHDPRLLILDEPTNGMDPKGRQELIEMARDLSREKGMSVLFSSHLLPDVEAVCEHIMVMGGGTLLASGRIEDLKKGRERQYEVRTKFESDAFRAALESSGVLVTTGPEEWILELPESNDLSLVWNAAQKSDTQIRSLRRRKTTLESIFLDVLARERK